MSESIGHTYIYNIIIIFVLIVFAFLMGTLSYYKAYKVNNVIVSSIEKYEGYNVLSKQEIERSLGTLGYSTDKINCKDEYKGMSLVSIVDQTNFRYCIYIDRTIENNGGIVSGGPQGKELYKYGVLTYMNLDLPLVDRINIPVFTRTNYIYKYTTNNKLETL